jgi:hypothetical protein
MISDEMKTAMQGLFPSLLATCSLDGIPNATVISQCYFVDQTHVALSHQFFNKTHRNVRENPQLGTIVVNPEDGQNWYLELDFDRSESDGPVFDEMDMKIEAIASMTGMAGVFTLKAADIYRVRSVRRMNNRKPPPAPG